MSPDAIKTYLKLAGRLHPVDNRERFEWANESVRLYLDGNEYSQNEVATLETLDGVALARGPFRQLCKTYDILTTFHDHSGELVNTMPIIRVYMSGLTTR